MDVVVHFIDVGVGDAIFIELPDKKHEIIIDGGDRRRGYNFLEYISPDIDDPIELAVITHPDYDHWSGISRLFKNYKVNMLWDPGYNRDCKFTGLQGFEKAKNFAHEIGADSIIKYTLALFVSAKDTRSMFDLFNIFSPGVLINISLMVNMKIMQADKGILIYNKTERYPFIENNKYVHKDS